MRKQLTPAEINAYAKNAIIAYCATDCSVEQACNRTYLWHKDAILKKIAGILESNTCTFTDFNGLVVDVFKIWDEMLFIAMSKTV